MTLRHRLTALRRPSLLIRAARHGIVDYDRPRMLARLTGLGSEAGSDRILDALLSAEAESEDRRVRGGATYSVTRHVELLVALMAEARLAGA